MGSNFREMVNFLHVKREMAFSLHRKSYPVDCRGGSRKLYGRLFIMMISAEILKATEYKCVVSQLCRDVTYVYI